MRLICASHPTLNAVARCVSCGLHLCEGCRRKAGVRNFCRSCLAHRRGEPLVAAAAVAASPSAAGRCMRKMSRARSHRTPSPRSATLAAALSIVPGLGQAYAGRFLRGLLVFGAACFLAENPLPLLLGSFLYVFNLWDAYRLAELRNQRGSSEPATDAARRKDAFNDSLFTLTGLGVLAYTFFSTGGLSAHPAESLLPLASIAAALLIAQETRD